MDDDQMTPTEAQLLMEDVEGDMGREILEKKRVYGEIPVSNIQSTNQAPADMLKPAATPKPRLGLGFMDSSDEEADTEPNLSLPSKQQLSVRKKIFSDSEDEILPHKTDAIFASIFDKPQEETDVSDTGKKKQSTWSDPESDGEDAGVAGKKKDVREKFPSPKKSLKDAHSEEESGRKSPSNCAKPRKERFSKKRAMAEMEDLHKESQRLVRETKVSLPKYAPPPISFTDFFNTIVPKKTASSPVKVGEKKLNFKEINNNKNSEKNLNNKNFENSLNVEKNYEKNLNNNDCEIEIEIGPILTPPPSKLDRFINRFLKHANLPVPHVAPPTATLAASTIPVDKVEINDNDNVTVEREGRLDAGHPAASKTSLNTAVTSAPKLLNAAQFDHFQKPGAKLSALKAFLQDSIMEKKERIMERKHELFQEETERKEEKNEEEMNKIEEEAELTDELTDTTESESDERDELSEPDELNEHDEHDEIVGDDYGKDQKEAETNEYGMEEAEEADEEEEEEEEEEQDEEEDEEEEEVDLEEEEVVSGSVLKKNDPLKRMACDEDDEDPLAGLGDCNLNGEGEGDERSSDSAQSDITPSAYPPTHSPTYPPNHFPLSLAHSLETDERDRLMQLCSFDNDNAVFAERVELVKPTEPIEQVELSERDEPFRRDIMGSIENSQQRDQLMGLLSCASGDFQTYKGVSPHEGGTSTFTPSFKNEKNQDEDVVKPRKMTGSKKSGPKRRRDLLDSDEEEILAESFNHSDKDKDNSDTDKDNSDKDNSDTDNSDKDKDTDTMSVSERQTGNEEDVVGHVRRRVVQVASDSEEDADDEEEEEEEDFYDGGNQAGRFRDEDEEMEYLERQFKPDAFLKVADFVEEEADLSEDDYRGSEDENEDDLDELRQEDVEFQDNRYISLKKQQRDAVPEYLRKIGEDDENLEEVLKERFLREDENLPKLPSTFFGEGIVFRLNEAETETGAEAEAEAEADDNEWRVKRFEREEMLASRDVHLVHFEEEETDPEVNAENSFFALCKNIRENADASFNLQSESFTAVETDGKVTETFKRNSLWSRGPVVLARLNEVIDVEERKTAPQPILAMQSAQYRKSISLDQSSSSASTRKLQRTESSPAGDGPSFKRQRLTAPPLLKKKNSVFTYLDI